MKNKKENHWSLHLFDIIGITVGFVAIWMFIDLASPEQTSNQEPENIGTFIVDENGTFNIPELKDGQSATILIPIPQFNFTEEFCINLTNEWEWCSSALSQEHFEYILSMYTFSEATFGAINESATGSFSKPFRVQELPSVKPNEK